MPMYLEHLLTAEKGCERKSRKKRSSEYLIYMLHLQPPTPVKPMHTVYYVRDACRGSGSDRTDRYTVYYRMSLSI